MNKETEKMAELLGKFLAGLVWTCIYGFLFSMVWNWIASFTSLPKMGFWIGFAIYMLIKSLLKR